jgi:antitoxin VapB
MMQVRHVKLFRNKQQNRVVRIPRDFELPGSDAIMWCEGVRLIIEPVPAKITVYRVLAEERAETVATCASGLIR